MYRNPLRKAIRRLKYSRDIALGDALASHLIALVEQKHINADVIIPVPLAPIRQRERGYNQAALLARPLALALGLPYQASSIERTRETLSQVGLTLDERRRNVAGAFSACSSRVSSKAVLLVDDVLTTGATLDAAAAALRQAGASRIDAVVVSRA
jgi:ComF family protein